VAGTAAGPYDLGVTSPAAEPVIDGLAEVWSSMAAVGAELAAGDWDRQTDCPGWSVRDQYAHLIGIERMLQGEAAPPAAKPRPAHVRNDFAAANEPWVAVRRDRPGSDVLAEFGVVTAGRLAELGALAPERFDVIGPSPVGQVPYRRFMEIRIFDSWVHEQDVRRAVGRPGGRGGVGEARALAEVGGAMARVVGRAVAPADGTTVVFDVSGPLPRVDCIEMVAGRGTAVAAPSDPTTRLVMEAPWFWRLGCGRSTADEVLASGEVRIEGHTDLGTRVLGAMSFTI
jgi:uncharacterized protein (TIGR03083 family)